jgi:hypothetical protein
MKSATSETRNCLVGVFADFLSGKALYGLAGIRAAVKKRRHKSHTRRSDRWFADDNWRRAIIIDPDQTNVPISGIGVCS